MAPRLLVDYRKLAGMILTLAVMYGEFFCHWSQAFWKWPRVIGSLDGDGGSKWMRVLLVADPQLVGLHDEPPWPIGAITRWDADRYLSKTFGWALSHVGPLNVVAFMGDLIDEGSTTAYGPDYKSYVARFRSIYPSDSAEHFIYVSGDNDVGGEGADPVTGAKVDRFRAFFPEKRVTEIGSAAGKVKVVVHNVITRVVDDADPDWELREVARARANDTDRPITLMMSHIPVLHSHMSAYSSGVLNHFLPDVILSAHVHKGISSSMSRSPDARTVNRSEYFTPDGERRITIDISSDRRSGQIREIVVPACSYRMGQMKMAFGLLSVNPVDGLVIYDNLWLAERFPVLFVYAVSASISIVLCMCSKDRARRAKIRKSSAEKRLV